MQIVKRSAAEFAGDPWETKNTRDESAGAGWEALQACRADDAMQDVVLQVGASWPRNGGKSSVESKRDGAVSGWRV
jgi:hypothetical protein